MAERHATDGQRRPTTRTTPIGTPASITRSHAGGGSGYRPGVVDPGAVVRAALVPNNESPSASHEDLGRIER
jgi:hypothetical protein